MTLVSVIGDFFSSVAPVFYDLSEDISTHIIISDDSKRDSYYARQFQKGVENFCNKKNKNIIHHFVTIDEDSNEEINKACEYILKNSQGEIFVNISDGLATLNTVMTQKLLPENVKFISYDIFDNEYHIINTEGIVKREKARVMDITEHFILKNSNVICYESVEFVNQNEDLIWELFDKHLFEFNGFKKRLAQNTLNVSAYPHVSSILKKLGFNLNQKELVANKKTITGSLFEMYVYIIVKRLGFDDVLMGAVIENEGVKNEFDLLVMKDNHLNIIECKFKNINKEAEKLLFKYAFLREILDYDSKALIISNFNVEMKYKNRAKRYNVDFVDVKNGNVAGQIKNFFESMA